MSVPFPEIDSLNDAFEREPPERLVHWALVESGVERVAIASAFQADGTCVIHMATRLRPDVPILFLDTGFHFEETLRFKEELTERLDLNVIDLRGEHTPATQSARFGARLYERDPDLCCRLNKVEPFTAALHAYDAWFTALRRESSPSRATTPLIEQYELEPGRWMVKVNPIAAWTRRDVWRYLDDHGLPKNPLYEIGFAQIGCAPCTRPLQAGEHERAGRWDGAAKVECGIHVHPART